MTITNWLFGTCGRSHIGVYECSQCGYELLRSGFERNVLLKSLNLQALLPVPVTVAAAKGEPATSITKHDRLNSSKIEGGKETTVLNRAPFNDIMLEDFTKNANLARTFHKNSLVKRVLGERYGNKGGKETGTKYEMSCGRCGSSLGHQIILTTGQTRFHIKNDKIDLTFRST